MLFTLLTAAALVFFFQLQRIERLYEGMRHIQ
jgi:hypothetical protein